MDTSNKKSYTITQSRLLYVISANDTDGYKGLLKIGEFFVDNDIAQQFESNALTTEQKNKYVYDYIHERKYYKASDNSFPKNFKVELVESTTFKEKCYTVQDLYVVLEQNGKKPKTLDRKNKSNLWFKIKVDVVKRAIEQTKNIIEKDGHVDSPIVFRPEQNDAIKQTYDTFKTGKGKRFLWNAKMRFGKTTCGLELARKLKYRYTLIVTHRPAVDDGWKDDFHKIFGKNPEQHIYASRSDDTHGDSNFSVLENKVEKEGKKLVFFVSMQYLRLSTLVGGENDEQQKKDILNHVWDLVIIDEAHEGTESRMGKPVLDLLRKPETNVLSLSGTPFNLIDQFPNDKMYTWDYVMEQKRKQEWEENQYGDPNPYAVLPKLNIYTFEGNEELEQQMGFGDQFSFKDMWRVWTGEPEKDLGKTMPDGVNKGDFIHEAEVKAFIEKLRTDSSETQYPFSNETFRRNFAHTFWILPGVKEAAALENLLLEDEVFKDFDIINVAGDNNKEDRNEREVKRVKDAIKNPEKDLGYTITLSCGKLTTGVSVPDWTAVLMLSGSAESSSAATYMQTIFRSQTHAQLYGRQKTECYVFDFSPLRALTCVAEATTVTDRKGRKRFKDSDATARKKLNEFIQFCPLLSLNGATLSNRISTENIFKRLNNIYIQKAVQSGFSSTDIYNIEAFGKLTDDEELAFLDAAAKIGKTSRGQIDKLELAASKFGLKKGFNDHLFVYLISAEQNIPAAPIMGDDIASNGAPLPKDDAWVIEEPTHDELTKDRPYLYYTITVKRGNTWEPYKTPMLKAQWEEPKEEESATGSNSSKDKERKIREERIAILRSIAIRIPLMFYGAEINDDPDDVNRKFINLDNFCSLVDDESWIEFMPKGFEKQDFSKFKKFFSDSVFSGAADEIRGIVRRADKMDFEDRIHEITTIFGYLQNPDKETVLTPWPVVNRHMCDTIGGYTYFAKDFKTLNYEKRNADSDEEVPKDHKVEHGKLTDEIYNNPDTKILEINSKSGLYPLFIALTLSKTLDKEWEEILKENIYVVCRTPMAASITRRTLGGFKITKDEMNVRCYTDFVPFSKLKKIIKEEEAEEIDDSKKYEVIDGEQYVERDMIDVLRTDDTLFTTKVSKPSFWNDFDNKHLTIDKDDRDMKFSVIVGNPPYQLKDGGNSASSVPIYHNFLLLVDKINSDLLSMIMPA